MMSAPNTSIEKMPIEIDVQVASPLTDEFIACVGGNPEDFIKTVCIETVRSESVRVSHFTSIYLSVLLTDDVNIQEINNDFRNIDNPTDVLSFPQFESDYFTEQRHEQRQKSVVPAVIGDIVVSWETVFSQAKQYDHGVKREFAYVVVHGLLHLLGYDHEDEEGRAIMRAREERVLTILQLER